MAQKFDKKTKERIERAYENFEIKKGRKPNREEKEGIRKNIINKQRKSMIRKIAKRVALFGSIGVIGIGGYRLIAKNNEIKGITDGKKIEIDIDEEENTKKENIEEKEADKKTNNFKDDLKVLSEEEKIQKEIENLKSKEQVLNYLKNIYIEAYERQTGDESLTTADIEIMRNNQNYMYELEDGQLVSHGDTPAVTEGQIEKDGKKYNIRYDLKTYTVRLNNNGEAIDSMTIGLKKVIPGDNYNKMKDGYDSVLCQMGSITGRAFELREKIDFLNDNSSEYNKQKYEEAVNNLAKSVYNYYEKQKEEETQINTVSTDNKIQEDDERE